MTDYVCFACKLKVKVCYFVTQRRCKKNTYFRFTPGDFLSDDRSLLTLLFPDDDDEPLINIGFSLTFKSGV